MPRFRFNAALCLSVLLAVLLLGQPGAIAQAQSALSAEDVNVTYNFGDKINFQARLQSPLAITQASLLFRRADEEVTRVETLQLGQDGSVQFAYDASLNVLPPFSVIVFWFQASLADGTTQTSPTFFFHYDDNRFPWQQISAGGVTAHWYVGDQAFGQAALDAARVGLSATSQLLALAVDQALDVYVYSSPDDLQGTLALGGKQWTGGHADPALGVVMVAIAPGEAQSLEMETEIPHELAHVLLFRDLQEGYASLPVWLNEGVASMAEAYPKPDYANALAQASQGSALMPISDLCAAFPPDSGRAFLAYAESQSFTRYVRDTYGLTGLAALLRAYADGLDCELGAARAVGVPLSQLDTRWRETVLGQNVGGVALRNLAPYLLVMLLALVIPIWGAARMFLERREFERQSG